MSNKENLKHYLIEKEKPFLLDENNNGKTIMLSGEWGSGKTHFWQKEIEPILKEELLKINKACLYVSLYGKDNLDSLKKEILINASSMDDLLSKEVSSFGFDVLSSIKDSDLKIGQLFKSVKNAIDTGKTTKGVEQLQDGGVICFDDFERKSEKINLNDLFGFISQLSIELNCKIVIILNSDVFKGKEAEIFSCVKEKTISKYFDYKPSIEELFNSIYESDAKHDPLNDYKQDILKAIEETAELNARIYIQVLDNCLEWLSVKKKLDSKIIRVLVLTTINFVLNHMILDYKKIDCENNDCKIAYDLIESYPEIVLVRSIAGCHFLDRFQVKDINSYIDYCSTRKDTQLIDTMRENVTRLDFNPSTDDLSIDIQKFKYPESLQKEAFDWIKLNEQELKALWKYGYRLYYVADVDESTYNEIAQFIQSGILI